MATGTVQNMQDAMIAAAAICRARGARWTPLRQEMMALLLATERPSTAYALLDRLRAARGAVAPPTVYRTLDFLIGQGLAHRVGRLNAFVACTGAGHEHHAQFLICRTCGAVSEIEDIAVNDAVDIAAALHGFRRGALPIEIDGWCGSCAAQAENGPSQEYGHAHPAR